MIHYHGTPITPRERLYELAGRNFCVSFAEPRDVKVCHEIGQSVMLDNGAFSFWGDNVTPDWPAFYRWCEPWLDFNTTWVVIPDVIDGSEEENDRLLVEWFQTRLPKGAPVWHLHESLDRLRRLAHGYERVCFGSSGRFRDPNTYEWQLRVSEAFDVIADEQGRVPWVHMLRAMKQANEGNFPFASADSTNAARNSSGSHRQRPRPIKLMVEEIDSIQSPARWRRVGTQTEMEVA